MPARTGTTTTSQTGGDADLTAFLDHLASHPNVAPFISRLLIQRLVTSNPTPAYVGRVSAAFANSGGDLKAVIRAILLDSEARDYSRLSVASHGLVREPYTRYIAMARALRSRSGRSQRGRTLPRLRRARWGFPPASAQCSERLQFLLSGKQTRRPAPRQRPQLPGNADHQQRHLHHRA